MVERGWFYLRIDSAVVANWTILDWRLCGARPIDQWNRGSDDGEGCQADSEDSGYSKSRMGLMLWAKEGLIAHWQTEIARGKMFLWN